MCGIVGYVGARQAAPILLDGLKRLEYRGYDSAGVCIQNSRLSTIRTEGKLSNLELKVSRVDPQGTCGIAHTRWATHGAPEERNAHPHRDCLGNIGIVHNGIIENFEGLKRELMAEDHVFHSATDSEVVAHLIERALSKGANLFGAVQQALQQVQGTYGLVVISKDVPQTLIAARMGSPLAIGIGQGEYFIASDASAILSYTKEVIFLDDGEIAIVTSEGVHINGTSAPIEQRIAKLDWGLENATKGDYPHFMLKEIMEQAETIENSIRGRIDLIEGRCVLGGLDGVRERLREIDRIVMVGCGSAYYAGLYGKYLFEELIDIPVEVELSSEFRYRKPLLTQHTAILAISQSGETADTLEAIREGKRKQALALGLVNSVGSSIARETDAGVYNHAGPEIGVASTKAFVSQLTVLALIAVYLGQLRGGFKRAHTILAQLSELPDQMREVLGLRQKMASIAKMFHGIDHCLFLGRRFQAPIAYEAALKLKEVSYIHAEGYTSGEMKHGPLALIDNSFPSVVFCPRDSVFEKSYSNMQELKARHGPIIAVTTKGDAVASIADRVIEVPETLEELQPILTIVPAQLLAYEVALARGLDPDKPRNLAKSVTVE